LYHQLKTTFVMTKEIKSFDDLVFGVHSIAGLGSVQAMHELPNGITISVVGGMPSDGYMRLNGDGVHTFEVAAWHRTDHEWIKLGEGNVLRWQTREQVTEAIQKVLAM
jgi:hypothetical protein